MQANPASARDRFAQIVRNGSEHFVVRLYMAEAAYNAGDSEETERIYRELIHCDPGFVPAYVQLSELLAASGNSGEAELLLTNARKMDPDHWRLKAGLGEPNGGNSVRGSANRTQ